MGRRFTQVEILGALAAICLRYTGELAVDTCAIDVDLINIDVKDRVDVWQKAAWNAGELMLNGM